MHISNVNVYGLENAIRVSKFPMAVNAEDSNEEVTKKNCDIRIVQIRRGP